MDAVLTLAVTDLVDEILGLESGKPQGTNSVKREQVEALGRSEQRDLLLLAACYDQSTSGTFKGRWQRLRQILRFKTWKSHMNLVLAVLWSLLVIGGAAAAYTTEQFQSWRWLWLVAGLVLAGWLPRAWQWVEVLSPCARRGEQRPCGEP
jgi:hypothetical protein